MLRGGAHPGGRAEACGQPSASNLFFSPTHVPPLTFCAPVSLQSRCDRVQITGLAKSDSEVSEAQIRRALLLDTPRPTSRITSRGARAGAPDRGLGDASLSAPTTKRRRALPDLRAAPRPPKRSAGRVVRANELAIVSGLRDLLARTPVKMTIAERADAIRAAASELDALVE